MPAAITLAILASSPALAIFQPPPPARLASPDPVPEETFGYFIALDGPFAVTSDYYASLGPAVYVYDLDANTVETLTPSSSSGGSLFGISVDVSGSSLIAGDIVNSEFASSQGAAFVFVESAGAWSEQQALYPPVAAGNEQFGRVVAIDGDTAIVGAPGTSGASGAAHIFTRTAGVWTLEATLQPGDLVSGDFFGLRVAIHGDTVAVGAPVLDGQAGADQGAVYIFTRSAGVWTQQAKLFPSAPQADALFGATLALSGDTCAVSAYYQDTAAGADSGAVFVFERAGVSWMEVATLTPTGVGPGDLFGAGCDVEGDTLVISAPDDDDISMDAGAAYVYRRIEGVWTEGEKILPTTGAPGEGSGYSVALSDGIFLLAAGNGPHLFVEEPTPQPPSADITGDGVVNGEDLAALLASWGTP